MFCNNDKLKPLMTNFVHKSKQQSSSVDGKIHVLTCVIKDLNYA